MSDTTKLPEVMDKWELRKTGNLDGLVLQRNVPIPNLPLGSNDILLQVRAVSINSRDVQIINGLHHVDPKLPVVPFTDAAGVVLATGRQVSRFKPGSRCTTTFHPKWFSGAIATSPSQLAQVGALSDGVLQQYLVLNEEYVVAAPEHLSYEEACTLPTAGVTAWSALFGGRKPLKPGECVLTQGSGGVSQFAIMFAKAAGAFVIATTGQLGSDREAKLRELGADIVLSYKDDDWGKQAKKASPGNRGADIIVDTSGAGAQDANALALGGSIAAAGGSGGGSGASLFDMRNGVRGEVRKMMAGSREQFEEMNRAIDINRLKPLVDKRVFSFQQVKEALEYAAGGRMSGKVVIRGPEEAFSST